VPSPVTIKRGTIGELRANEHGLTRSHYAEVRGFDGARIDWATLERMEEAGDAFTLCAWDGLSLVGYVVAQCLPHPHDGRDFCYVTAIYARPDCRTFGLCRSLMNMTADIARSYGMSNLSWSAGIRDRMPSRFAAYLDRLSRRPGSRLRCTEVVYEEELI